MTPEGDIFLPLAIKILSAVELVVEQTSVALAGVWNCHNAIEPANPIGQLAWIGRIIQPALALKQKLVCVMSRW